MKKVFGSEKYRFESWKSNTENDRTLSNAHSLPIFYTFCQVLFSPVCEAKQGIRGLFQTINQILELV